MPFPNEHSARLRAPGDFKPNSFRRTKGGNIGGKTIPNTVDVISGQLSNQTGDQRTTQALRFPVSDFSVAEARAFVKDNEIKAILFEPALDKVRKSMGVDVLIKLFKESNFQFLESSRYKMNEDVDGLLDYATTVIKQSRGLDITFKKSNKFFKAVSNKKKNPTIEDVLKQIIGKTTEDAGHIHTFDVDKKGNGKTSDDAGHIHDIKAFNVAEATGTTGIEHDHDLILGNKDRKKKGVIKCRMEVVNKTDEGYELAYALDSSLPRTAANFAIGAVIKSESSLEDGSSVLVKCDSVEALEVDGKWGVNLLNPVLFKAEAEKRKPDTTKQILKQAVEENVLSVDDNTLELLKERKLINGEVKKKDDDLKDKAHRSLPLIKIKKKQLVYGVVYEPLRVDSQKDYATAPEIEKAAHTFLEIFNSISLMHKKKIDRKAKVVESFIAPVTFQMGGQTIRKGSWVLVTHVIDKQLWKDVESGVLDAYSIEGTGLPGPPIPELER